LQPISVKRIVGCDSGRAEINPQVTIGEDGILHYAVTFPATNTDTVALIECDGIPLDAAKRRRRDYAITSVAQLACDTPIGADEVTLNKRRSRTNANPCSSVARYNVSCLGCRSPYGIARAIKADIHTNTGVGQGFSTVSLGANEVTLHSVSRTDLYRDRAAEEGA